MPMFPHFDSRKRYMVFKIPREKRKLCLDVGCGEKHYAKYFGECIGIDLYSGKADIIADWHHLPFRDNAFDCVLLFDVLEHTDRYGEVLREVVRVAKPGAMYVLTTVSKITRPIAGTWDIPRDDGADVERDPSHLHCFTEELLKRVLRRYFALSYITRSYDILFAVGVIKHERGEQDDNRARKEDVRARGEDNLH